MEPILESKSFNNSMELNHSQNYSATLEKLKSCHLHLKGKIIPTDVMIEQYNDIIQQFNKKAIECKDLKKKLENAKKETEEWKKKHCTILAKDLKVKMELSTLKENEKKICDENSELRTKIAANQSHIHQLTCKLDDKDNQHSEKLMEIELEKSGLQSEITEMKKEIKLLYKTYNVNKADKTRKNAKKQKRGKKLRSPMKTTRSTGLLSEIDEMMSDDEIMNAQMSSPQSSINLNAILTTEIENETITTISDLPQLHDDKEPDNVLIIPVKTDVSKQASTTKPITVDKNVMTDEFYGIKDNVYPLLCDKCETLFKSAPLEKIAKAMTVDLLLTPFPLSPIRIRRINRGIQTDIPAETNLSMQNDSNVSLAINKVQKTLESLEKQMKRNDKKRRNSKNISPHCNHTFSMNCCDHNGQTLSQMNMMTSFWSSMMKLADKRLSKPYIKRKRLSNKKLKVRKEIKKKQVNSLNPWIVESDTSFVTNRSTTNFTPNQIPHVATTSEYARETIKMDKKKNLFNSLDEQLKVSSHFISESSDTNHQMNPDNLPYTEDIRSFVDNENGINSFENAVTSTPTNLNFVELRQITRNTAQNSSIDLSHLSVKVDPTSRKQMRPTNLTQSISKSRTELQSDTCVTDQDQENIMSEKTSHFTIASTYLDREVNKKKILFNLTDIGAEVDSKLYSQESETNFTMYPENLPHIKDNVNSVHDSEVENSFEKNATINKTNFDFRSPEKITKKVVENVTDHLICSINEVSPTSQEQKQPVNVTRCTTKGRNKILQKLRQIRKDQKPVRPLKNIKKAIDHSDSTDKVENQPIENLLLGKRRIAHVSKVYNERRDIMNVKRTKITCSMTKSEEDSALKSPKSTAIQSMHSTTDFEQSHQETKTNKISNKSLVDNSFGLETHDKCEAVKIIDRSDDSNVNDTVDKIFSSISDIMNASKSFEEHIKTDNVLDTPNIHLDINKDNSGKVTSVPKSYPDSGPFNAIVSLNKERHIQVEKCSRNTRRKDIITSQLTDKNNLDCSLEKKKVNGINTSIQNHSETQGKNEDDPDSKIEAQVMNSVMKSSAGKVPSADDSIPMIPNPNKTKNAQSLLPELDKSTSVMIVEMLRKRRRINDLALFSCKTTPGLLTPNNSSSVSTLDKLSDESKLVLPKSTRKKAVPEIIQNEFGKFFNTKRIITRSMKKSEELMSAHLEKSHTVETTPLKCCRSPEILIKITTPVKSANDTPLSIPKNDVKSLFSCNNYEENNSNSYNDNNPNQLPEPSIDSMETVNPMKTVTKIHCNNINSESQTTTVYCTSTELSDQMQPQDFPKLIIKNGMKFNESNEQKNTVIATQDERKLIENVLPESAFKIPCNDDVEKESTEKLTNAGRSIHEVDQKIPDISPTFDSPLSPDPIPIDLPECSISSNRDTPLQSANAIVLDSPYLNAVGILTDESSQQPLNITHLQDKILISTSPPTNVPKHCGSSVKELRNRKIPFVLKPVPTISKNDEIIPCVKLEFDENMTNIKSLFEKHFMPINQPKMKVRKFQDMAAIEASKQFIEELKQEIRQFIISPNWDTSIYQSVMNSLSKVESTKSITQAIVDLIIDASATKEIVDQSHTPPAPLMTPSQQKTITLIQKLNELKPDLISLIFNVINHKLFHAHKDLKMMALKSLAQIFVSLSKIRKDRQRVRIMICDALYNMQAKSVIIIHTALTSWPEVLPICDENRRDYLLLVIVHIIKNYETKIDELTSLKKQVQNLINFYYKYSETFSLPENMVDILLEELTNPNYHKGVISAILILAKKQGTVWTYKHIIKEKLLAIIIKNQNSSAYDALILLGYLMKCFPLQDTDGSVKNIVEQLCTILDAGTMCVEIQEGAIMALLSLSYRFKQYPKILKSILMWRPSRPFSPALRDRLETLFKSRTSTGWCRIKI